MPSSQSRNRLAARKSRLVIAYAASIVVNGVFWLFCGHLLRSLGAPTPPEPKDRTMLHAMQVGFYKPKPPVAPKPAPPKSESIMAGASGGTPSSEQSSGASAGKAAQAMQADAAAGSGTGISQALQQSGAGTAADTHLAAATTADAANDPSLASSLAPDQVHLAQKPGGAPRPASTPRTQTAGSTRTGQRDAAQDQKTQIAQQAATDPDAEMGDETGASEGGVAEKKPPLKPNATIVLKLVKTWTPRLDQKFELPPNLNIQLPDTIEIQPGPPVTPEQIEQIRKMLASQKMRHVGLDRKQLKKLLDAARKTRDARKPEEKKNEKKETQVAKKPAAPHPPAKHNPRIALVTPSKPRSPFTYRQWNPEMASEWMPDQDLPQTADASPKSSAPTGRTSSGAKTAIAHESGKASYAIARGSRPATAPGTGGLSHSGQDGSNAGSGQQDGINATHGQHGGVAGAGQRGNDSQSHGGTRGNGGQQGASVPGGRNQGTRGQPGGVQQGGVAGKTHQGVGQQNSSTIGGRQQNGDVSSGQPGSESKQNVGAPGSGRQGGQQNGNASGRGNRGNAQQRGNQQNGGVPGGSQAGGQQGGSQQNGDVPGGSQRNNGDGQQNGVPGAGQQGNGGRQGGGGQQNGVPGAGQGSGNGQQNEGVPGTGQGNGGGQPQGGVPGNGLGNGGVPGGGQGQGMAENGNGQGQSPGLMGNAQGQEQGQGNSANAGVGVGGDGMLSGESADGMQSESDAGDADGEETGYVAAVGGPPDPPDHDPNANKGIPGALVLPPSPPVGTDNGTLPDPRPVKKSHVQRPVGNPAVAKQPDGKAAPAQRAAKIPVGLRDKTISKPQPPVLTVGSTSTHGTYVLTVMNRPHLALGIVSDTIDPPIPPARGDRKSPLLKPKKTTSHGMSASHGVKPIPGNQQDAPLVRVAKNSQGIKDGTETPLPATLLPSKDSEVGDGSGLKGEYYLGRNFDTFLKTQADANIEYDWHYDSSPDDRIPPGTNWSIRWTGKIAAPTTEKYTFYASADDGVRVWINHRIIIDDWTLHAAQEYSNTVDMIAGKQYDIKVEYFESGGPPAGVELYWESPTVKKQFIPESAYFYPLPTDEDAMTKDVVPSPQTR